MHPGESLDIAKSLAGDLDDGELLDGEPQVTVWQSSGEGTVWTDVTASLGFTVEGEQINPSELPVRGSSPIPAGLGVACRLTSTTRGSYKIRLECDGDDGSHAVGIIPLVVSGPGVPS